MAAAIAVSVKAANELSNFNEVAATVEADAPAALAAGWQRQRQRQRQRQQGSSMVASAGETYGDLAVAHWHSMSETAKINYQELKTL